MYIVKCMESRTVHFLCMLFRKASRGKKIYIWSSETKNDKRRIDLSNTICHAFEHSYKIDADAGIHKHREIFSESGISNQVAWLNSDDLAPIWSIESEFIQYRLEFRLVPKQSEDGKHNPNLVWFSEKIRRRKFGETRFEVT